MTRSVSGTNQAVWMDVGGRGINFCTLCKLGEGDHYGNEAVDYGVGVGLGEGETYFCLLCQWAQGATVTRNIIPMGCRVNGVILGVGGGI